MKTMSGYVHTNGIKIQYERLGEHAAPLIMCHGITDNGRCLLRLGEHIASHHQVYLIDARGHGLSDSPTTGYSADDHAEDLNGLILELNLVKPILYGHSMGARTVTRLAAKYPEIPHAVILEDPVYITPPTETESTERDAWHQAMRGEIARWKTMPLEEHIKIAKSQPFRDWTAEEQREWAKSKLQVSPAVFEMGLTMHLIREDFPKIKCPVLILKADAEPDIMAQNEQAVRLIPNGTIIHIKGAGHNIRRDNYQDTVRYIDQFLTNL